MASIWDQWMRSSSRKPESPKRMPMGSRGAGSSSRKAPAAMPPIFWATSMRAAETTSSNRGPHVSCWSLTAWASSSMVRSGRMRRELIAGVRLRAARSSFFYGDETHHAARLAFGAVGEEVARFGEGASWRGFDVRGANAAREELIPDCRLQVDVRARMVVDDVGGIELLGDLGPDLEVVGRDARADVGADRGGGRAQRLHGAEGFRHDRGRRSAPSRMDRADDVGVGIGEEDDGAVRRGDAERDVASDGHEGIEAGEEAGLVDEFHAVAVDLAGDGDSVGVEPCVPEEAAAVLEDELGIVSGAQAQVERAEGGFADA